MNPPLTRREFGHLLGIAAGGAWLAGRGVSLGADSGPASDLSVLPTGASKRALPLAHFPSRLHALVWRNWSLVPAERLAATVGARRRDIVGLAVEMGLPRRQRISPGQDRRSYISVIKRNWHLLPYDQLLVLLGWSPARLAHTLREDDFLWVKLGSLKPVCEPVRWSADVVGRGAPVREVIEREFGSAWHQPPKDPLFGFVRALSRPPSGGARPARAQVGLRYCYSYFALYGDPLMDRSIDPFPEGYLQRLAELGVTGLWLHSVLYQMAEFPWQPSLSAGREQRLERLGQLERQAAKAGLKLFLYLNEPRAMPVSFFEAHPDLRGAPGGDHACLCTSVPAVREYLEHGVASIARAVPGLGGFFTITASENLTHCWSHGGGAGCPRCRERSPAAVVAEASAVVSRGLKAAGSSARLIAWDWGWSDAWAPEAIRLLPEDAALMSVSEWSLPLNRGGVPVEVGEYSLSAVGPGPRAQRHWALARARGLKTVAKIQANNSWELSALPYLPVLENVAEQARRLRALELDGTMLGWTLGGCPSPNLEVIAAIAEGASLEDVASRRHGPLAAPVLAAWRAYSEAFREFPYAGQVVYSAPLQTGPANLLWPEPTGYGASMVGFPYDDLRGWRGPYPAEVFVAQLRKVASGFAATAEALAAAIRGATGVAESESESGGWLAASWEQVRLGRAAAMHFGSVAAQSEFVLLRDERRRGVEGERRDQVEARLGELLEEEAASAKALWAMQREDSRFGFEATNHYFYVPEDLAEKVLCVAALRTGMPVGGSRG